MYCPCPYHEKKESLVLFKYKEKKDAKLDFKNDEIYPAIEARAEILASKKWTKQQGDKKIN